MTMDLPGWTMTVQGTEAGGPPNLRCWSFERGNACVRMTRHWDQPLSPGYPMVVASRRVVRTGAGMLELVTTRVFEGQEARVDVAFIQGADWLVRIVFENCDAPTVDAAMGRLSVRE
ncbi:hypothetical protein JGU66_20855 [Myxococcaceae bacterium JPH2]|nr:hypothetical protein [Myxococcaceae bacterium JPH2]